jgi:hypothetical protein
MAFGGYDSILLCHQDVRYKLYGVSQAIGYGETKPLNPIGGGLPINKYYFLPLHQRLKFYDFALILQRQKFFSLDRSKKEHAKDFYSYICDCEQCHDVVKDNIDNINEYNESVPFFIKGSIKRNRPTNDASYISNKHFINCKIREWRSIKEKAFIDIIGELKDNYKKYSFEEYEFIKQWCDIYEK